MAAGSMKEPRSEPQNNLISVLVDTRFHSVFRILFPGCLPAFILVVMLSSCENDVETVNLVSAPDTLPVEIIRDMEVIQSEYGKIQFVLSSPLLERYDGDDPYIEFPEGVKIVFYDSLQIIKSELTANWGISWEKRKVMEAKNNVVVINHETQEQLNTEHLIWNKNDKLIHSDVFVKITTPDKTIYGENGMEADEKFNSWKLKKVRGDIMVDKNEF